MAVHAALHVDIMERSTDEAAVADAQNLVALLTPVIKAHFSDLGMSSTLSAQQIFGGHGYVREHGMEQLVRDCRIAPIYEGTNEVQAIDLVARKLTGKTGEFASRFMDDWQKYLVEHANDEDLAAFAKPAAAALQSLIETTGWVREKLQSDEATARGAASQYLRLFALTIIACYWVQVIVSISDKSGAFYDMKRKVAHFYMQQVLPETAAIATTIVNGAEALADISVGDLTG